jgi:hypothetical protein
MTTTDLRISSVLASARDVLSRAEARAHIPPRVLARFAKKVRLAEKAVQAAQSGGTSEAGLRTILARAEAVAAKRIPTPAQTRALDDLRARLARLEAASGATDVSKLTESLQADTSALEAELAKAPAEEPLARKTKDGRAKEKSARRPAKRAKKRVR